MFTPTLFNSLSARFSLIVIFFSAITACSTMNTTTTPSNVNYEGLSSVSDSNFDELYIRPGTDFTNYRHIYIKPIEINYSDRNRRRAVPGLNKESDFQLTDSDLRIIQEQLVKAIAKQWNWETVDSVTEDSVILELAANDFYLYGSINNNTAGRTSTYTNESSSMTLLAKLRDSQSNQLLLVSNDKRKTGSSRASTQPISKLSNVVFYNDTYHTFNRWAGGMSKHIQ